MARKQARRRHRRREEVEDILKDFEASDLSVAEFARSHGISVWTFRGWMRRHKAGRRRLIRVRVANVVTASAAVLEVTLINGRLLRVPAGFDATSLARLLPVLDERC